MSISNIRIFHVGERNKFQRDASLVLFPEVYLNSTLASGRLNAVFTRVAYRFVPPLLSFSSRSVRDEKRSKTFERPPYVWRASRAKYTVVISSVNLRVSKSGRKMYMYSQSVPNILGMKIVLAAQVLWNRSTIELFTCSPAEFRVFACIFRSVMADLGKIVNG